MKRFILLFTIAAILGGCVSPGMVPPKETVAKFRHAYIVAMEPHPLGVPPGFRSVILGSGGSIQSARAFGLFNTVAILLEMPEASKRGAQSSESLQAKLDTKAPWAPTITLANEVRAQLATYGIAATIAPNIKPIPGVQDRSYTVLMENWLAPIRAWYNDTEPVVDYPGFASDQSLYVLEVGVINYEIGVGGGLLLQVAIKVIDPSTGRVIGRARAFKNPNLDPLDQAFANDASRFKEVFSETSRELVRQCLTDLGLLD